MKAVYFILFVQTCTEQQMVKTNLPRLYGHNRFAQIALSAQNDMKSIGFGHGAPKNRTNGKLSQKEDTMRINISLKQLNYGLQMVLYGLIA